MENVENILQFLEKRFEHFDPQKLTPWDGLWTDVLNRIFTETGNGRARTLILSLSERILSCDKVSAEDIDRMEYTSPLCILFAAYRLTQEDKYKQKILELEKSDMYTGKVFDMMYETAFGGKERYHAITVEFAKLYERARVSEQEEAFFMEALIDTVEAIDQPVYELYRSLVDLFRQEIRVLFPGADKEIRFKDDKAAFVLACAVKKACRMKVILAEKYEAMADRGIDSWKEED